MTLIRISEILHEWTGWCPNAQVPVRKLSIQPLMRTDTTSGSASPVPGHTGMSLARYRRNVLVFACIMTGVSFSLYAVSNGNRLLMLGGGILAAVLLFSLDAVRYWALFDDAKKSGAIDEMNWNRMNIIHYLVIFGSILIICIAVLVFLGFVPGTEMLTFNAFLAGFGVVGWFHLALVSLWERKNGQILYSDGKRIYVREGC